LDRAKRDMALRPEIERVGNRTTRSTAFARSGIRCVAKALILHAVTLPG
jgi:hypothetical protein